MPFSAIINTPGYMPWADQPALFDSAREAWSYLADQRTEQEDQLDDEGEEYSATRELLALMGDETQERGGYLPQLWNEMGGLTGDGEGTIYGATPGYDGDHDLGLAYSVTWLTEDEWHRCCRPPCGGWAEFVRLSEGEPGRVYRCTECHMTSLVLADGGEDED